MIQRLTLPGHGLGAVGVAVALALQLSATSAYADAQLQSIHDFNANTDINMPMAGVTLASDGYLYGTASVGGLVVNGGGGVFRLKPDGSDYAVVHAFDSVQEGYAQAGVIAGLDGAIYGVTEYGDTVGPVTNGSVFRLAQDGTFTLLHVLAADGSEGAVLAAGLVQDRAGRLYGVATSAGTYNQGTIFSVGADGSGFTVLHQFAGGIDGAGSVSTMIIGTDGRLYGTFANGGAQLDGGVFSIATDGSGYRVLHAFAHRAFPGEGMTPLAGLSDGGDGWFYGTTNAGGDPHCACGTVFRIQPTGTFETLYAFDGANGAFPVAAPTFGPKGTLFGTALQTLTGDGTVYELNRHGKLLGAIQLPDAQAHSAPFAPLLLGPGNRFYTTTMNGGGAWPLQGSVAQFSPADSMPAPITYPVQVTLDLTPATTRVGKQAVLQWTSQNARQCVASGAWTGERKADVVGRLRLAPTEPGQYTYTLTCTGPAGTQAAQAVLTVLKATGN